MTKPEHPDFREGLPFLGGSLWIDLLNTTPVLGGQPVDLIGNPAALIHWARLAGVSLPATTGPEDVARTLTLREALRTGFKAILRREPVPDAVIAAVNTTLQGLSLRLTVTRSDSASGLALSQRETVLGNPLDVAAAKDFARFVGGAEPERMRHCANPSCTMVFHDHGKNNRRRWCSMAACGNRDKVARFRARQKTAD